MCVLVWQGVVRIRWGMSTGQYAIGPSLRLTPPIPPTCTAERRQQELEGNGVASSSAAAVPAQKKAPVAA